jgi:hypothetical protein
MYRGYDGIVEGNMQNCLKDLTGAPTEKIDL